jgi:hypothetical protein
MQDRENETGPSRWSKMSKSASMWMFFIIIPLLLINFFGRGRTTAYELTYSEYKMQLDAGNIDQVSIIEGKRIEGGLRTPIARETKSITEFWTLLPIKDSEQELTELKAKGVRVKAIPERAKWWLLIIQALPVDPAVRLDVLHDPSDAGRRLEGVPVRQVEGAPAHGRYAEGDIRGCRGRG